MNNLLLRPIASNTRTATHDKYLAQNFYLQLVSRNIPIKSLKQFAFKEQKVPNEYQMLLFDVTSLFSNVPFNDTIDIILWNIYIDMEIGTTISNSELKDQL